MNGACPDGWGGMAALVVVSWELLQTPLALAAEE